MRLCKIITTFTVLLTLGAFTLPAHAQSSSELLLSLDNPTVTVTAGTNVLVTGNLANHVLNGSGDTLTLADDNPQVFSTDATVDDTPYITYWFSSPDTLNPGDSTGSMGLFNIDVASTAPAETITGSFGVNYYDSSGSYFSGNTQPFTVNVLAAPAVAAVPEPSEMELWLIGASAVAALIMRRRTVTLN